MSEYIELTEKFPEENEIVNFRDYNGVSYYGFYILPYRAYPNSYFDPLTLAKWCIIERNGNWHETNIKPVGWKCLCEADSELGRTMMRGHYIKNRQGETR